MTSLSANRWVTSFARLQLPRSDELQQHRGRRRVDEPRGDRDIAIPELLEVQLHGLAVDANVRQAPARRENGLADVEGGGNADRLDRDICAGPVRERQTCSTAVPSELLISAVAPNCSATRRRLSSTSIIRIAAGE